MSRRKNVDLMLCVLLVFVFGVVRFRRSADRETFAVDK
jgi:hypothetical protein